LGVGFSYEGKWFETRSLRVRVDVTSRS
ncbi:MAG: hypothetical protein J07HX5_00935, partial [halophilic archaeon J07HX5]